MVGDVHFNPNPWIFFADVARALHASVGADAVAPLLERAEEWYAEHPNGSAFDFLDRVLAEAEVHGA